MAQHLPGAAALTVYPVTNYTFGSKPPKYEKDTTVVQRMERLKDKYAREGPRRSVDAAILVHDHGHPHVLLTQIGNAFFKLPGGRLRPGEDELEGLMRKLTTLLAPAADNLRPNWRIADVLGTYFRPNFENLMYPYLPPHIQRPKEFKRIFLLALPERCYFAVPKNMKLIAVPLFEIYDHVARYGPVISAVPSLLSRFQLTLADRPAGGAMAAAAAAAVAAAVPSQQPQPQQALVQHAQPGLAPPPPQQQQPGAKLTITLSGALAQPQQPQQPPVAQQPQQYQQPEEDADFTVDFDE